MTLRSMVGGLLVLAASASASSAGVIVYGDENLMGTGTYPSDPTAGATLQGLAPNVVTVANQAFSHGIPTGPVAGSYPGTDQVYSPGGNLSGHDAYSDLSSRVDGPQNLTLDYSKLVASGQHVSTLTLGLAADDVQQPGIHEPFVVKVNGIADAALTNQLNSMDLSGPKTQFFSAGIDSSMLNSSNILSLSIDRAGSLTDGWGLDFATIGVTTVPEPTTLLVLSMGVIGLGYKARKRSA